MCFGNQQPDQLLHSVPKKKIIKIAISTVGPGPCSPVQADYDMTTFAVATPVLAHP